MKSDTIHHPSEKKSDQHPPVALDPVQALPVQFQPIGLTTLPHRYALVTFPVEVVVKLTSSIVRLVHGLTALHWKLATSPELVVPVVDAQTISLIWNSDDVQFPAVPLKVVH
jgi:hypothetical protein